MSSEKGKLVEKVDSVAVKSDNSISNSQKMIEIAMKEGNIGALKEAYAFHRQIEADKAKELFDQAMADFQMECPIIEKKKEVKNNQGKLLYKYAPLDSIVSQVKELIAKHGFSYIPKTKFEDGKIKSTVVVRHTAGHSDDSTFEVKDPGASGIKSASQATASEATFSKRQAFCNAFGIMTGDEDVERENVAKTEELPSIDQKLVDKWCGEFGVCTDMKQMKEVQDKINVLINQKKITKGEVELILACANDVRNQIKNEA